MFIHKKFKGETRFPSEIVRKDVAEVKPDAVPNVEVEPVKKPATRKKASEKTNEEKNEE